MQPTSMRISSCITAFLLLPTISARFIFPLSVVATRPGGFNVAVDPRQVRSAPALDEDRPHANSAGSAPLVYKLEDENAGSDDGEDFVNGQVFNGQESVDVNGQEDFVNTKVRRIVRMMQDKHPPFVRFG